MGVLSNPKHEKFAQGMALGLSASAAYVEAGFKKNDGNASRLKGNEKVIARVKQLSEEGAKRAAKTLDDVIAEYERIAFTGMSKFIRVDDEGLPVIDLSDCTEEELDLLEDTTAVIRREPGKGKGDQNQPDKEIITVKVKPMDRLKALEKLGTYLGMSDTSKNEVVDRLALAIQEISKRGSAAPIATAEDDD
jgi:phage terminase small subunit